jgi:hypothetical protein
LVLVALYYCLVRFNGAKTMSGKAVSYYIAWGVLLFAFGGMGMYCFNEFRLETIATEQAKPALKGAEK